MDAIKAAFDGMSAHQRHRVSNRIADGKENIVFGFAFDDGTDFEATTMQDARKIMYGFD